MKQFTKNQIVRFRKIDSRNRVLPGLIVAGAQKAATTSLHYYLSQHSDIHSSLKKEIHYFDGGIKPNVDKFDQGKLWYQAHFDRKSNLKIGDIAFETSPFYMFHPEVPGRIKSLLPDVKLIFLLRDPVERAISHYFHTQNIVGDPLPMLEAFIAEDARISSDLKNKTYNTNSFINYSYKSRGLYKEQLSRFYDRFCEKNLLVIQSEKMHAEPQKILSQIFHFLGIKDMSEEIKIIPKNVNMKKEIVDTAIYEYLGEYFQVPNEALFKYLGIEFDWSKE